MLAQIPTDEHGKQFQPFEFTVPVEVQTWHWLVPMYPVVDKVGVTISDRTAPNLEEHQKIEQRTFGIVLQLLEQVPESLPSAWFEPVSYTHLTLPTIAKV